MLSSNNWPPKSTTVVCGSDGGRNGRKAASLIKNNPLEPRLKPVRSNTSYTVPENPPSPSIASSERPSSDWFAVPLNSKNCWRKGPPSGSMRNSLRMTSALQDETTQKINTAVHRDQFMNTDSKRRTFIEGIVSGEKAFAIIDTRLHLICTGILKNGNLSQWTKL